jgi:hypothetical protein
LSGLNDFERRVLKRYGEQSRPTKRKEKKVSSLLMTDYMRFIETFRAGPREQRIRIRPETLARCEQSVGTAAYMRWYLSQLAERLHT